MNRGLLVLLLISGVVQAKNLGTWGEMYPIAEQDMLTTIHTRLKAMEASGEMAREQEAFRQRVIENTLRPKPVDGLTLAQENTTHYIDPSLTVSDDLKDHHGRVFARKGQVINPLDTVPFTDTLYFIDANNPQQLTWMKAQKPGTLTYRVILVNGDIREATRALNTRIYFDQDGTLSRKFELRAIPARVTLSEDRRRLRVDTFALSDAGQKTHAATKLTDKGE
ncbi:TPA: type-F conjugative transfer system protein TraW [Enterobacter cloacae]|nr:type-F conjugative transfer system protein TraW [Enterobacter cloacae]